MITLEAPNATAVNDTSDTINIEFLDDIQISGLGFGMKYADGSAYYEQLLDLSDNKLNFLQFSSL